MPAYISSQPETSSSSMFMATTASRIRMPRLKATPMKLSTGDQIDELLNACFKIMKPISTMPEGVTDATPDACSPIRANDWMIELAKAGPLRSSQRKKPKNRMKRMNSAKNSPMSALRSAMKPNVKTSEIVPSVQNRNIAAFITTVCQDVARVANSVTTWSSIPWLVSWADAAVE